MRCETSVVPGESFMVGVGGRGVESWVSVVMEGGSGKGVG